MEIDASDIELPRIQVMQGISQKVMDQEARFGELRSSLDNDLLGDLENPLEFIPFGRYEVYHVTEGDELVEILPPTAIPGKKAYVEHGSKTYRLVRNFYVLLPGKPLPFILSFKKTSGRAGKALLTHIIAARSVGKKDYDTVMKLIPRKEKNDKGTYITLSLAIGRESTLEEKTEVAKWIGLCTRPTPSTGQQINEEQKNYANDI